MHSAETLLRTELRRVGEVLDHEHVAAFLDHLGADHKSTEVPRHATDEGSPLGGESNLDEPEPRDVGTDELAEEVLPRLFGLLLEDLPPNRWLVGRSVANGIPNRRVRCR